MQSRGVSGATLETRPVPFHARLEALRRWTIGAIDTRHTVPRSVVNQAAVYWLTHGASTRQIDEMYVSAPKSEARVMTALPHMPRELWRQILRGTCSMVRYML
jgi:hypothetical protein